MGKEFTEGVLLNALSDLESSLLYKTLNKGKREIN